MIKHELPEGWEIKKLGEVAEILDNKRKPINQNEREKRIAAKDIQDLYPYYGATGQVGYIDNYLIDGDFVLLGEDGAPFLDHTKNKAYMISGKSWVNNHAHILSFKNNRFFMHYLNIVNYKEFVSGTTRLKLNKTALENIPLIVPPISTQKQIVTKIEQLFGKLDGGVNILETLKQQVKVFRQSILKAAFSGKLTGSYASDDELPANWYIDKIANILKVHIGSTPSRKCPEFWNGDINWVSSGEVAFNKILDTKEKITNIALEKSSCKLHPKGTVLIGMIGEGKTRGQVAILGVEASHNQNSAAIRIDNSIYLSETLFYYLVLKYEENRGIGSGNNQKALNKSRVGDIAIPVIPIEEQKQIVAKIEKLFATCDELDQTIDNTLNQSQLLRQSILKQAFTGNLITK